MMKISLNIDNLTDLWKVVSSFYQGYATHKQLESAHIKNTQWPNRVWIKELLSMPLFKEYREKLKKDYKGLTFSSFTLPNQSNPLENDKNFKLKSIQYGMSWLLDHKVITYKKLSFELVEDENQAKIWSNSFSKSFGYEISPQIVTKTKGRIPFYLVYFEGSPIGTVILYSNETTMGIHSLGIIPEKRRQGFATEIMSHIINKAIDEKVSLVTLQASEMAKKMYIKMGFSIDFLMSNYQIK